MRAAVEAQWRATVAARRRRYRVMTWSAAAGVAVAAVGTWLVRPLVQTEPNVVASLTRVVGSVERSEGDGRWVPVGPADPIESGNRVRTAASGRAALRFDSGLELRLDGRTQVAFVDSSHAALSQGAIYVDAGSAGTLPAPRFELDTPAGRVAHLGTQYEARILDGSVRVAVREGRVSLSHEDGELVASGGESLTVRGDEVVRAPLAPTAAEWRWLADVTPPFSIEDRSVEEFLVWTARQTGRTIVYASPDAARQARSVTLSGTVEGLPPDEAVRAVLATTSLQPTIGAEHIRVEASLR